MKSKMFNSIYFSFLIFSTFALVTSINKIAIKNKNIPNSELETRDISSTQVTLIPKASGQTEVKDYEANKPCFNYMQYINVWNNFDKTIGKMILQFNQNFNIYSRWNKGVSKKDQKMLQNQEKELVKTYIIEIKPFYNFIKEMRTKEAEIHDQNCNINELKRRLEMNNFVEFIQILLKKIKELNMKVEDSVLSELSLFLH